MRADFALDYDVLTVEQPHKLYLMAYVNADSAAKDRARRPLNLCLVIDRSGSMAGDKIDFTRQAAQLLVQNLGSDDLLSIVLYNEQVETLLMPEFVRRKDYISQQIASIKPGGTTNLSGGWLEACRLVAQNRHSDYLNRVILMSDGLANRGVTATDKLVEMARQKYDEEGITTTTMGLGTDFNEDLMMEMANAGGGAFYFIESPEATPTIFQEELQGLLSLIGQNLTITLEHSDHVREVRQLNLYPTRQDANAITYRLGDLFGDEVKALLLELSIPAIRQLGDVQIATLRFHYDELNAHGTQPRSWEMPVRVNVAPSDSLHPHNVNVDVRRAVLLLKAAQARAQAVSLADGGEYGEAAHTLREMVRYLEKSGYLYDPQISEERDALARQAEELSAGKEKYGQYSRKTMSTQALYTMSNRHDETMVLRLREQERMAKSDTDIVSAVQREPSLGDGRTPTRLRWNNALFILAGDVIRIGRATENEIVISARGVSRAHCRLTRRDGKLILEDVGSTNGTLVNGRRLTSPYTVSVGDELRLSEERLVFEDDERDS